MPENTPRKYLRPGEFILVSIVFILVLVLLYYVFFTPNYYEGPAPVKFEIQRGESLSNVIDRLYNRGVIPSKMNMRIASVIYGADTRIRAARYYIPNGLSYLDLLDLFIKGKADFLREIKIFNGTTSELIASRMKSELFIDSTEFLRQLGNDSLLQKIGNDVKSLNGFLLPGEYYIFERTNPEEIMGKFIEEFNKLVTDSLKRKADESGRSLSEIITLASIVEAETNDPREMPLIAGVYYNRLKIGMRLQADPTVQYVLKNWRRLSFKDLAINSPYNTYRFAGLPPGPINNPGKDAILAAFNPARHRYLYFSADSTGKHRFSETFAEHTKNAGAYRKWLNQQEKQ